MILLYLLILIGSCVLLIKSSSWTIKTLTRIARTLRWGDFFIAVSMLAFGTSLPELFVGLNSAFHRLPQLSFGNIIGANILNLTIGIALVVFLAKGIQLESEASRKSALYAAFFVFLSAVLIIDSSFSRLDGIIMLLALVFYFQMLFRQKERFIKTFNREVAAEEVKPRALLKDLGIFFGSLILLLISAEGIIRVANFLAIEVKLPLISTGIFILSLGTVIPEMVLGIKAIKMRHSEIALGDFIGTIIINSGLILGIVGVISPFRLISTSPYIVGILFSCAAAIAFAVFAKTGRKISQKEALVLTGIYLIFIITQILVI